MSTQLFIKIIIFQTRESARSKGPSLVDASVETDETGGLDDLKIIDSGCGSSVGSCDESNKNLLELYQDFRVSFKFKNGPNKASFLLIFALFKHKFYRKNCRLQWDSNWDR